jgi:hypothetical protein
VQDVPLPNDAGRLTFSRRTDIRKCPRRVEPRTDQYTSITIRCSVATTVLIWPIESKPRYIGLATLLLLACHAQKVTPTALTPVRAPPPATSAAPRVPDASIGEVDAPRRLAPALLLLSIDGLMPSQVLQSQALGAQVPNLRQMVEQGAYATGVRTVVPSLTYPAHTTLITGTSPATHGILGNLVFDPTGTNKEGWYWYADVISVPTLWSEAKRARYVTANVFWPVSVGAPVDHTRLPAHGCGHGCSIFHRRTWHCTSSLTGSHRHARHCPYVGIYTIVQTAPSRR